MIYLLSTAYMMMYFNKIIEFISDNLVDNYQKSSFPKKKKEKTTYLFRTNPYICLTQLVRDSLIKL